MNNAFLGRTLKAMYKLSGKTISQLSEESELTVDTINNLFYARIQKPGLAGVCALVKAMGFQTQELISFMDENEDLPEEADITEMFTNYIHAVRDTVPSAAAAKPVSARTEKPIPAANLEAMNAEYERQLDRFRDTHLRYADKLQTQYEKQIEQLKDSGRLLEERHLKSTEDLKAAFGKQIQRQEEEIRQLRKRNRTVNLICAVVVFLSLVLSVIDALNRNVGWLR